MRPLGETAVTANARLGPSSGANRGVGSRTVPPAAAPGLDRRFYAATSSVTLPSKMTLAHWLDPNSDYLQQSCKFLVAGSAVSAGSMRAAERAAAWSAHVTYVTAPFARLSTAPAGR